jgi:putative oxidoreductase
MVFLGMVIAFAARALLVMLFLPFSALDKVLNFKQAVGQAAEAVSNRSLATALIFAGLGVEASASGFQQFMAHPLASSHPYSHGAGGR